MKLGEGSNDLALPHGSVILGNSHFSISERMQRSSIK